MRAHMIDNNSSARPARAEAPVLRRIDLDSILRGEREVIIRHGADEYHLRLTSNDKLLLTK